MNKVNNKKILFLCIDTIYAFVFGLIIGAGFGVDVTKKLNEYFG
ncbi:MAG: hypothetical protein RSC84_01000 [Peptostreptococcaceae bacterium]